MHARARSLIKNLRRRGTRYWWSPEVLPWPGTPRSRPELREATLPEPFLVLCSRGVCVCVRERVSLCGVETVRFIEGGVRGGVW